MYIMKLCTLVYHFSLYHMKFCIINHLPPPSPLSLSPSVSPSISFSPFLLPPPSLASLQKEQLRIAIMDYLNHHSREKEKLERLQLVALKFKMFRELAKVKEKQALKDLKKIKPKSLGEDIIFSLLP